MEKCKHDFTSNDTGERYYSVVRVIEEKYQVFAKSKEEAAKNIRDPHTITVLKERITKIG